MFLESLKKGDKVIVDYSLHVVCRTTKTLIFVDGVRFRKSDGYEVGKHDAWQRRSRIKEATKEAIKIIEAKISRDKAIFEIKQISWSKVTTSKIVEILACLKA